MARVALLRPFELHVWPHLEHCAVCHDEVNGFKVEQAVDSTMMEGDLALGLGHISEGTRRRREGKRADQFALSGRLVEHTEAELSVGGVRQQVHLERTPPPLLLEVCAVQVGLLALLDRALVPQWIDVESKRGEKRSAVDRRQGSPELLVQQRPTKLAVRLDNRRHVQALRNSAIEALLLLAACQQSANRHGSGDGRGRGRRSGRRGRGRRGEGRRGGRRKGRGRRGVHTLRLEGERQAELSSCNLGDGERRKIDRDSRCCSALRRAHGGKRGGRGAACREGCVVNGSKGRKRTFRLQRDEEKATQLVDLLEAGGGRMQRAGEAKGSAHRGERRLAHTAAEAHCGLARQVSNGFGERGETEVAAQSERQ